MTTPTSKSVPSDQPADLLFNAEAMDAVLNSNAAVFMDRLGQPRRTLKGLSDEFPNAAANAASAEQDAAAAAASRAVTLVARDQASAAATAVTSLPALSTAAATIAAGRAAVADGATFWVKPNVTDGLLRYTSFTRLSNTTQQYLSSLPDGAQLDRTLNKSDSVAVTARDAVRRVGLSVDGQGMVAAAAAEIGRSYFPLPAPADDVPEVVRTDMGVRHAELGERSRFVALEARTIHGQDYSLFRPVRQRRIVASDCYSGSLPSTVAGRAMNCRKVLRMPAGGGLLQFSFANTFWAGEAGGFPTLGHVPGPITMTAAVEFQGLLYRLTVGGNPSVSLDAGATVDFDLLHIDAEPGTMLPVRMFVTPAAGGYFPIGTPYFAANGDGVSYTASEVDQTGNAAFTYPAYSETTYGPIAFGPIAVTGQAYDAAVVVAVLSDSTGQGSADAFTTAGGFGWAHRALAGSELALLNLSQPSERAAVYATSKSVYARLRWVNFADHAICGYGINDLTAGASLATLQADLIRVWRRARNRGCVVWQNTITPVATSTDGFATLANQTASGAFAPGGTRVQLNDWIRAGAPMSNGVAVAIGAAGAIRAGHPLHPLHDYIEAADSVESSRNSCKWAVDAGALTADGTHPNALGHARWAAAVPTNRFI